MPNSHSVPTISILTKKNDTDTFHTFLPKDKLIESFTKAGIDTNNSVATTCGSGVTGERFRNSNLIFWLASVLALGLHLIGNNSWAVYDGSWAEWGRSDLKTEVKKL
jgi:thiosulfate/3-mercaptopyruvate sulfurtransferase